MNSLLNRFCRYVRVETTANEKSEDYPSSSGQRQLGEMLCQELCELGLQATLDDHSIVSALLPGNVEGAPTIAWLAHMDTSPEACGKDVDPQIVEYKEGDILLKNGRTIPASDRPGHRQARSSKHRCGLCLHLGWREPGTHRE